MVQPKQLKEGLPRATHIELRREELMTILMIRNSRALAATPAKESDTLLTRDELVRACDFHNLIPLDKKVLERWIDEEAIAEDDAKCTRDYTWWLGQRYTAVLDERLPDSRLVKYLIEQWETVKELFPEHERETRRKRLDKLLNMMETLERETDHGKIPDITKQETQGHESKWNNYHLDDETTNTNQNS